MPVTTMQDGTSLRPQRGSIEHELRPGERLGNFKGAMVAITDTDDLPTTVGTNATPGPEWLHAQLRAAGELGTRAEIQAELDQIAAAVRQFHARQPDQVMKECAAYGARLTELCVLLHRVEAIDRQYQRVRTQQVERWLTELERQFKIASRLVEVQRQDLALLGGQP